MTASVVAIATVSVLLGGGVISLAWALVKRADIIGDLREQLAVEKGKRKAEEADSDGLARQLEVEIERTEALAEALSQRGSVRIDPAHAVEALGGMLKGWRDRAAASKDRLSANRKLRDAPPAGANKRNAGDGRTGAGDLSFSEGANPELLDTDPGTPGAIAAKDKRP